MRIARNKFLVEVSDQFVRPNIKGLEFIDTDFNPKILATKVGRINSLPICVGSEYKYETKLNVGDEIVFNHLVCQERNKFSNNIFFCQYYNIFARIQNGELEPLEDVFFCHKIVEPDTTFPGFHIPGKVSGKHATVMAVSALVAKEGVKVGDIVYFTKNADYEIVIAGNELYKMHLRNIIGIKREGKLTTFRNKLLVKDVTELGFIGGLEKIYANTSLRVGVVMESGTTGIAVGTRITYFNGVASVLSWKGEDYSFINEENIKFVI
ncbi:MAG: hypothetical protein V4549_07310 [Bacteroidota bacterium]